MKFNSETAKAAGSNSSRKGVPNKSSEELKNSLKTILENNIDKLQSDIDTLTAKERIDVLLNMAAYILPKQKAVEFSENQNNGLFKPVTIINLGNGIPKEHEQN